MITVTDLELRAGARLLSMALRSGSAPATGSAWSAATAPARPPRCASSPARRCRTAAGSTGAARSATCRRTRVPATSPSPPATASCRPAASTRCCAAWRRRRSRWPRAPGGGQRRDRAVREYGRLEERFAALGGYAAEAEAARICSSLGLPDRVLPQPLSDAVRRSAPAGRTRPDPVQRRRHAAARRADQPPRRRQHQLAAGLPEGPLRRPGRHQPRCRAAGRHGQQGLPPGRQPRRPRHLQRRLEDVPPAARDRRAAPQAGAGQRREEDRRS